jgi:hypothetical protein
MNGPKLPASVMTTTAHPNMSQRYVHVNTHEIITAMKDAGFSVASANASRSRKGDSLYGRHCIDFRLDGAPEFHGAAPRVLFVNSHDGTTTARAVAGLFKFACSNGLVIGHKTDQLVQRHSGEAARELVERMMQMARKTEDAQRTVEAWSKKQLTTQQRYMFARLAAQLRWGNANMFEPEELLKLRRAEDDLGDLWSTYNRLQENTVRGGLVGLSASGRRATSRPLTDIQRDISYNADLWRLTTELAEAF